MSMRELDRLGSATTASTQTSSSVLSIRSPGGGHLNLVQPKIALPMLATRVRLSKSSRAGKHWSARGQDSCSLRALDDF